MDEKACCAHLRIKYNPVEFKPGSFIDRWKCGECGTVFVPGPALTSVSSELAAALQELELSKSQRNSAVQAEKRDAEKALHALAAAHIPTPEEGYGFNSSWAVSDLCRAVKDLYGQLATSQEREKEFRRLLWLRHGCSGLYGDDGEMQCGHCLIDFKRTEPAKISEAFVSAALRSIPSQASAEPMPLVPFWECDKCGNVATIEREILCWKCGKGEMIYREASQASAEGKGE